MPETNIEIALKQTQKYYGATPVILLGSGASAAFKMAGMWDLGQHLIKNINLEELSTEDIPAWNSFCENLRREVDLETALTNNRLSQNLTKKVTLSTWSLLDPQDREIFKNSISDQNYFHLGKLLKHLLRSTRNKIEIITTNYDRLAEYSCEQESIYYYTGFSQGYKGFEEEPDTIKTTRRVNIWKVHGSLGWFKTPDGINISLSSTHDIPDTLTPLIITPGLDKYEKTSREPYRTVISSADKALMGSSSYLCIGYGFNDTHIQEKLINKCVKENSQLIIITRSLTTAAADFIRSKGVKNYIAFTRGAHDNETVVESSEFQNPITIAQDHWSLVGFSKIIM